MSDRDQHYLRVALLHARAGKGFCAPNPAVGAIVVKNDQVIASGYHAKAGGPHAEVAALSTLSSADCEEAALYVTLEPCTHQGKTSACTDLIIEKKIARVVYGYADPNPTVAGGGATVLGQAGIVVEQIILDEINGFYQAYHHWLETGRPWVTAKIAMSNNGKIAGPNGERVQITGDSAQEFTHQQRLLADAILTTAKTVNADDPQLNARLEKKVVKKPVYVLDRQGKLNPKAKVFSAASQVIRFLSARHCEAEGRGNLASMPGLPRYARNDNSERLDLKAILEDLGENGIHDLWIEAGGTLFTALLQAGLLNQAWVLVAPKALPDTHMPAFAPGFDPLRYASQHQWYPLGEDKACCLFFQ